MVIFQIKVSLVEMKSKIWRRLEVDDSIFLSELHEYIQIAFNWSNAHHHYFIMDHRDLFTLSDEESELFIGPTQVDSQNAGMEMRDERKVRISDVLNEEQVSLTYVYGSEENWRHEIFLEKAFSGRKGATFPTCLMVYKGAPEEGKRDQYEQGKMLSAGEMKRINEQLAVFRESEVGEHDLWKELFELTMAYRKLQPWKWIHSNEMFIVEIPGTGEVAYCSVLGMNGQHFGLGVHLGNDGLAYKMAVRDGRDDIQTVIEYERSLLLAFQARDELKTEDLRWIKKLGLRFRGRQEWPVFRSMSSGYYPWHFSRKEVRTFCEILKQAIHVVEETEKNDAYLLEGYDGRWRARLLESGQWVNGVMNAVIQPEEEEAVLISEIEMRRIQKYRQVKMRLEFASYFEEEAIQERDGERPFFPNVVLGVEDEGAMIVYYQVFERVDYGKQLQAALVEMLNKLGFLPAEICVDSERIALKISALTTKLGIRLVRVNRLLNVEEVRR